MDVHCRSREYKSSKYKSSKGKKSTKRHLKYTAFFQIILIYMKLWDIIYIYKSILTFVYEKWDMTLNDYRSFQQKTEHHQNT